MSNTTTAIGDDLFDPDNLPSSMMQDHSLKCAEAIVAAENKLEALAGMVQTAECRAALLGQKAFYCFEEEEVA